MDSPLPNDDLYLRSLLPVTDLDILPTKVWERRLRGSPPPLLALSLSLEERRKKVAFFMIIDDDGDAYLLIESAETLIRHCWARDGRMEAGCG